MKIKSLLAVVLSVFSIAAASAQGTVKDYFGATPDLKVKGNELVDPNGKPVTLHGVMDTPSAWFNDGRWTNGIKWANYDDPNSIQPCIDYFNKIYTAITDTKQGAYCNLFRLHLDPCWLNGNTLAAGFTESGDKTYDPHGNEVGGEANIGKFSEAKFRARLADLYIPLIQDAIAHGLYVVVRPPGVFPHFSKVGDYYNQYLMTIWDIVSQNEYIKANSGQISLELGNEPVTVQNANGTTGGHMAAYFQPIVNKIRQNGYKGVIWLPGTGYQANYTDYYNHPITDSENNYGFAVHCYPGWYGGWDQNQSQSSFISKFEEDVPVVKTHPIVITEVDWSPMKEGAGHWNETKTQYTEGNFGTWATGTTYQAPTNIAYPNTQNKDWGIRYRTLTDKHTNISWTLQGTTTYVDMDKYLATGIVQPAFLDAMKAAGYADAYQACSGACMGWYREYACGERLPEYKKTVAQTFGNAEIVDDNKLCFKGPNNSGFIFEDLMGKKVKDVAELTVKTSNESTVGYRLDFRLKKSDGTLIGPADYISGAELGTRFEGVQVDRTFDIQEILAQYLAEDPEIEFEKIRINTAVPYGNETAAQNLQCYIVFNGFGMLETHATAEKLGKTIESDLTQDMFTTWDGYGADAKPLGATSHWLEVTGLEEKTNLWDQQAYYDLDTALPAGTYNFTFSVKGDVAQEGGLVVWGLFPKEGEGDNQWYGGGSWNVGTDWNTYSGTWTFNNGLTQLRFMLGKYTGSSISIDNVKITKDRMTYLDTDFEDGTVSGWTKPGWHSYQLSIDQKSNTLVTGAYNFGKSTDIVYGDISVNGRNYADLTDYDLLKITVTEGAPRLLFNRQSMDNSGQNLEVNSAGDYAKQDGNEWTIDLGKVKKDYGCAHLNCITPNPWGSQVVITDAKLVKGSDRAFNADYALHGAGYQEQSFKNALADVNATVLDATEMLNECPQTYEFSNPNCLFVQDNSQGALFSGTKNLVTQSGKSFASQQIALQDGYAFLAPADITVSDATYTRNMTTEWGTATVPFSFVVGNGTPEIYMLEGVSGDKMRFTRIDDGTAIPANTAIVYRNRNKGETIFRGQNIGKTIEGWNLQPIAGLDGWYICQSMVAQVIDNVSTDAFFSAYDVYAISGDKFVNATKKLTTKPFRAFFLCEKSTNAVRSFSIVADENDITDIQSPSSAIPATEIERYDAAGRRIANPQRGINIIRMSDGTVRKVIR